MRQTQFQNVDWSKIAMSDDMNAIDSSFFYNPPPSKIVTDSILCEYIEQFDDKLTLEFRNGTFYNIKNEKINLIDKRPVLFPNLINKLLSNGQFNIDIKETKDPLIQYFYLNIVKNYYGNHNTTLEDIWYRRHLFRSLNLVKSVKGAVLDVGCDNPQVSRALFPADVKYIGLDPGLGPRSEQCLIGMAEFLPIRSESMDAVCFLTSLDHILDYHAALDEAHRVLKPGGQLYLATLIWTKRAELTRDSIHFHHFRQHEIAGALANFKIRELTRYQWKSDDHRFGVYLTADKI